MLKHNLAITRTMINLGLENSSDWFTVAGKSRKRKKSPDPFIPINNKFMLKNHIIIKNQIHIKFKPLSEENIKKKTDDEVMEED